MADGRYAPSPTGALHLGNMRTALLAWLFARSAGSRFLLRIDDLDPERCRPEFERQHLGELAALGLDWDGEVVRQSERGGMYEEALAMLEAEGLVYPCFCTRAEIREAASAPHGEGLPDGAYPGTCRELSAAERAEREAEGRPPALRVRAGGARLAFEDRLEGHVEGVCDDFVVRRNDGAWAYNLATVADDDAQGVEEVVRGRDLIATTARQLWLYEALGLSAPGYAHVPLVLGEDGERLAKRHAGATFAGRVEAGETAAQVRSALAASVGLCEAGEEVTAAELVERFDPAGLPGEDGPLAVVG